MTSNPHNILPTVGNSLELKCMVNTSTTHMNTTLLHLRLYNNARSVIAKDSIMAIFKSFSIGTSINNIAISNAGTYICKYYLSNSNPLIQDSDFMTAVINVTLKSKSQL